MATQLVQTLALWRAWQEAQGLSARTIDERASTVRRISVERGVDPVRLQPADIIAFIGKPGLKPRTRWTYHQHLRAFSTWLVRTKLRSDDPMEDTPTPRRPPGTPRPVYNEQLQATLRACNRRRTRTMVLLAALAGLRVHEIAKLHGRDFDLKANTLQVDGKGGKVAQIPLHPLLVAEAQLQPTDGYWFPSYGGDLPHISRYAVGKAVGAALKRAGVNASAHQLRHWYGTALLEHGVDIRIVQELMRHSSLQSTQIYTQVSAVQRQAAIGKLDLPA